MKRSIFKQMQQVVLPFLLCISISLFAGACNKAPKETNKKAEVPNVILIMADDMGWGDTGYNGNTLIKTPALDQMALEGIQFNRFYSASAVCSPTRASVLTGRNPFRTGIFTANAGILRPEEVTLPELLKEQGYNTGHFGKWHLGTLTDTEKDANRGRVGNIKEYNPPALHGYDAAFVTESKVPTYDPMKKPKGRHIQAGWDCLKEGEDFVPYGTYYWDIEGSKVTENLDGDDSRVIMDRVLPFIDQSLNEGNPFFSVIWFHTPHMPCVAGPRHQEMYKEQDVLTRNYAGCITAMDEQIGRLRNFLKEKGVDSNTMIWFCSDNGPEHTNPGSAGPYLERKRSLHEGGVRVPGLLVWPGKIQHAFETDIPCVTSDYLPTITDVLQIEKDKTPYQLDGISLLPLIEGKMKQRNEAIGFCFDNQVSYSDDTFKLYARQGEFVMYNIAVDPSEANPIENGGKEMNRLKEEFMVFLESCQNSFKGKEYGTQSYDKLEQKWKNPLKKKKK
ncbi:sulfatase family protein [Carboxylicivirga marina]|uniref:sulfatase family protein n=1 Tax=Carboxylicivirga marina TaxID=2800988 RepID=UPI002593013C|nr:sulfatase-like hydrolase/transferase [uncultured Carboxylicivirga sp.]